MGEKSQQKSSLAVGSARYELARQDAPTTVAWLLWRQPMALWLDLRLTCSPEGAPSRYYKLDQMPMPAEVTGPSLEATAVVLLNGYMPTKLLTSTDQYRSQIWLQKLLFTVVRE